MSADLLRSPVIIIGCARSGTTLLRRVLNAHREIQMYGETDFLISRIWREAYENLFWFNIGKSSDNRQGRREDPYSQVDPERQEELERDFQRIAPSVARLFTDILEIDPSATRVWGFKEIKNGAAPFQYGWAACDAVFPTARWVHLMRNPINHIRSLALWNREPLTMKYFHLRLRQWREVTELADSRREGREFYLLKYEDLMADKEGEMRDLLGFMGLDPDPGCLDEFKVKKLATSHRPVEEGGGTAREVSFEEIRNHAGFPPGVDGWMERYGYEWPESVQLVDAVPGDDLETADPKVLKIRGLKKKNDELRAKLELVKSRLAKIESSPGRRFLRLLGNPKKLFRQKG